MNMPPNAKQEAARREMFPHSKIFFSRLVEWHLFTEEREDLSGFSS
jgi:hypothetical protein